jgi:transposase
MASVGSVWRRLLGVEGVVVEEWTFDDLEEAFVVSVRLPKKLRRRCSLCQRRCPREDRGDGRRCWRGLDLGTTRVLLSAESPRVRCPAHGVVVQAVPWARPHSGFTREFEDQCAWLAVHTNRTAVSTLMRVAWRTIGRMLRTVGDEARGKVDLLANLTRIGIDELSYKKGHKYVIVVIDHVTGRLVWMGPGRDGETLGRFFDALGAERSAALELVTADGAEWIESVVAKRAPQAIRCLDPFHIVQWATKALDEVRRDKWNELRDAGDGKQSKALKDARWALWKNPGTLTAGQTKSLAWIADSNRDLYRSYLLKEGLRTIFALPEATARERLEEWLKWAPRCRIPAFVALGRTIRKYRDRIEASITHGMSNAIVEAKNTQLRLMLRQAFGFHDVGAFIGLAMLKLGNLCPPLPGRA